MRACSTPAWDSASCPRLPVHSGPFHRRGYDTVWGLPAKPSLQAPFGHETDGRIQAQETEKECRNEWNGLHRIRVTDGLAVREARLQPFGGCDGRGRVSCPLRLPGHPISPRRLNLQRLLPGVRQPWRHVAVGRRGESHAEPLDVACPHPAVRARPAAASRRGRAITTMIVIDNGNKEQQLILRHQSAWSSGGSGQWSVGSSPPPRSRIRSHGPKYESDHLRTTDKRQNGACLRSLPNMISLASGADHDR